MYPVYDFRKRCTECRHVQSLIEINCLGFPKRLKIHFKHLYTYLLLLLLLKPMYEKKLIEKK